MDLVCFSHLRWNFVFQRPQHLLGRMAKYQRVFYVEEPYFNEPEDRIEVHMSNENVLVVTPHTKAGHGTEEAHSFQRNVVHKVWSDYTIRNFGLWYYTPMALPFTRHLQPRVTIFDCMDELSAFRFAPKELIDFESELFSRADIVFTGGHSLYQAKKQKHRNVHAFPSSIEKEHFAKARICKEEPFDQQDIPHPRFGFFGVLDERFDIDLLKKVAEKKPDWHFVLIGPVVKIDPATLPRLKNIHYLGQKNYADLPSYISGWDIATIPFALNESTRYISPTKTPEYLAAGKPVISTAIRDVVTPYGENGLVHIVSSAKEFIEKAEEELNRADRAAWLEKVDGFLEGNSWDNTCGAMRKLIEQKLMGSFN